MCDFVCQGAVMVKDNDIYYQVNSELMSYHLHSSINLCIYPIYLSM